MHAAAINGAWKPTDSGYAIEFLVPAAELKARMAPGTKFGFNYSIDEGGKSIEQFFADKNVDNNYARPGAWGVIEFEK